jgi:Ser/Thr protein kinase RdoA (MazF antagonist)
MTFASLSTRAQVTRLRLTALEALRAYPIEVTVLELLNHGFNTTFRVRTLSGERFALRLNVNSKRSAQQIGAEMAWIAALARDTDLNLPVPQTTRDGRLLTHVHSPDLGRDLPAALFSWLPGKDLGDDATAAQMRVLMDSPDNFQHDHGLLTVERREVIAATLARVQDVLDKLYAREKEMPLHADLHNWNLKWARGKLYVFDFDDSILGVPVQDLAISAYYLRDNAALEDALLEGYAAHATLPTYASEEYEAIIAGRNLVLLNDLLNNTTAELRAMLPRYMHNSVTKLRHYLETGVFKHEVSGLIPAKG